MDTKTCTTSLAIAASSGAGERLASCSAAVTQFLGAIPGGPAEKLKGLRELRNAYVGLKLNGQTASAIQAMIDDKIDRVAARPS